MTITESSKPGSTTRRHVVAAAASGAGVLVLGLSVLLPLAPAGAAAKKAARHDPMLQTRREAGYGTVLADSTGGVLYALTNEAGGKLVCKTATCLRLWPPLLVGSAATAKSVSLGKGVTGSIGFVKRSAAKKQVTFDGYPLYRFSGDHKAGQDNGEGIVADGGTWELVAASPLLSPHSSSSSSSSSSGYSSGYSG